MAAQRKRPEATTRPEAMATCPMTGLPMARSNLLLLDVAVHARGCDVCRAFDRPGGADKSRDGFPNCATYRRLYAKWVNYSPAGGHSRKKRRQ